MNMNQSIDSLIACLSANQLSDLDLKEDQIVLKDSNTPRTDDPDKLSKIKNQFLAIIQHLPPPSELSLENIEQGLDSLDQLKKRVLFLNKLAQSPLREHLLPQEEFNRILQDQRALFERTRTASLNKFHTFVSLATDSNIQKIKNLGNALINIDEEHSLKQTIEDSLKIFELKNAVEKKFPEIKFKLAKLPLEDRDLYYKSLVNGKFDPKNVNSEYLTSFFFYTLNRTISLCNKINQYRDDNVKQLLKNYLFSFPNLEHVSWLADEYDEETLKEIVPLLNKLYEKNKDLAFSFLNNIQKEIRTYADKNGAIKIIMNGLNEFYETHKVYPSLSFNYPVLAQIELLKQNPAFYEALISIPNPKPLIEMSLLSGKPQTAIALLLSKMPTYTISDLFEKLNEITYFYPNTTPKDQLNILLIFQSLLTMDEKEAEITLKMLDRILAQKNFNHLIPRLFLRVPIDEMLDDIREFLALIRTHNGDLNQIKNELKAKNLKFYNHVFEFTKDQAYWENGKKILERHPKYIEPFENWVKQGKNWPAAIPNMSESFREQLSSLFELEKNFPDLFEDLLQVAIQDPTATSLTILLKMQEHFTLPNMKALLTNLKANPELISNLPFIFSNSPSDLLKDRIDFKHARFIENMALIEPEVLSIMLREKNSARLLDMFDTYIKDPELLKRLLKIDTPTPKIWKPGSSKIYSAMTSERLKIFEKHPEILQHNIHEIPWDEVPEEIWDIDPQLPFKLIALRNETKSVSKLRNLLWGAVVDEKNALAYRLLQVKSNELNQELFTIFADSLPGNPVTKLLAAPASEGIVSEELAYLNHPPWDGLEKVLNHFSLPGEPVESRIQKLPIKWRIALSKLIQIGLSQPTTVPNMLSALAKFPDLTFINFITVLSSKISSSSLSKLLKLMTDNPCTLPPDFEKNDHLPLVVNEWLTKYDDKDPALFLHLFKVRMSYADSEMLQKTPDQFFRKVELDKRCSPPPGQVIIPCYSENRYTSDVELLMLSNPEFLETVKRVGVININLSHFKQLGSLYLNMLKLNPNPATLEKIANNLECVTVLNRIDWKRTINPLKFVEEVLTMAKWGQMDNLIYLLNWMGKTSYINAKGLFDMAGSGYSNEAVAILNHLEKFPADPVYSGLLAKANSTTGPEIQRFLKGLPDLPPPPPPPAPLQLRDFEADLDKVNDSQFETSVTLKIAESMRTSTGELSTLPVREVLEAIGIPLDSDYANHLQWVISRFEKDSRLRDLFSSVEMTIETNSPAAKIVRKMLSLPADAVLTKKHAQIAWLSAMISRPRQSIGVGVCYGTSWTIITQSDPEGLVQAGMDYKAILQHNALERLSPNVHEGTQPFPVALMQGRLNQPDLIENLLLKARENALSSMGGLAQASAYTRSGLIQENLNFYNPSGLFDRKIQEFNLGIMGAIPINNTNILESLRVSFRKVSKGVVQYENPHPVSGRLGWWHLVRKENEAPILDFPSYKNLQKEIMLAAKESLLQQHRGQEEYISNLFDSLIRFSQTDESLKEFFPALGNQDIRKMSDTPWMKDWGGYPEAVIATDLQFVGVETYPYSYYQSQNPEQMLTRLYQFAGSLPEVEQKKFLQEPNCLHPLTIPGHALCLKPAELVRQMASGVTAEENVSRLKSQSSGIRMAEFSPLTKSLWMNNWINKLPESSRTTFKEEIAKVKWDEMILEECGSVMWKTFQQIYKLEMTYDLQKELESAFLSILTPDMMKKIPKQLVGDLNWDDGHYNNYYLACGRSPLTGELTWYHCLKDGKNLAPYVTDIRTGQWGLMNPLSRRENGHLTYK